MSRGKEFTFATTGSNSPHEIANIGLLKNILLKKLNTEFSRNFPRMFMTPRRIDFTFSIIHA